MAVQISARVSETTKERLEQRSRASGIKKEFLVEEALLHHLQVLDELPSEIIIPPRIVIDEETARALMERAQNPRPTQALRSLMRTDDR
ncbi:hypothetical protein D3C86_2092560 [compost metagenome]